MTTDMHELWPWTEVPSEPDSDPIALTFARCFGGEDGERVIAHLRARFLDRRLPPSASDAALRHLEGARTAIAHICSLIEQGRA